MSIKLKNSVKESPDNINYQGKRHFYHDDDAIGFGFGLDGNFYVTEEGVGHDDTSGLSRGYTDAGRIWQEPKIITFWNDAPDAHKFKEIAGLIQDKTGINVLEQDWKLETDNWSDNEDRYVPTREYAKLPMNSTEKGKGKAGFSSHVYHQMRYTSEQQFEKIDRSCYLVEKFLKIKSTD